MRAAHALALLAWCGVVDSPRVVRGEDDDTGGDDEPLTAAYKRFENVEELTGTVTIRRVIPKYDVDGERTFQENTEATFDLELRRIELTPDVATYEGTATGNLRHFTEDVRTGNYRHTITRTGTGAFPPGGIQVGVELHFDDGTLHLNLEADGVPGREADKCELVGIRRPDDPPCTTTARPIDSIGIAGSGTGPLDRLSGSTPNGDIVTEWALRPGREDIELVVEPVDYEAWLPEGTLNEKVSGPRPLTVVARLQKRGGGAPPRNATLMEFRLTEVSTLPGVCINFPPKAQSTDSPDLGFEPAENPDLEVALGPVARTRTGSMVTATAHVSAFDFGGYGTLEVKAALEGGGMVMGHLAGDTASQIPIPKRAPGSKIAERWLSDEQAGGRPDLWDEEDRPEADPARGGHAGDALTLLEEYRGFAVDGTHRRGKALHKEMFIVDAVGGEAKAGIELFEHLTGLIVYDELSTRPPLEAEPVAGDGGVRGYVVNFNRGDVVRTGLGEHDVDKQAIGIHAWCSQRPPPGDPKPDRRPPEDCDPFQASVGGGIMGEPRMVALTKSATQNTWRDIRVGRGRISTNETAVTVAHELGHTASVNHHGDRDIPVESWRRERDAWIERMKTGNEYSVTLERQDGHPLDGDITAMLETWVGVPQGEHSGMEDCIMRYDNATAYAPRPGVRVLLTQSEMPGTALCTSPAGTGINAGPTSRYGDAVDGPGENKLGSTSHGGCKHQVCVNDRFEHE